MVPQDEKIVVVCSCGKKLHAPASAVGRKARCPKCGNVMTLTASPAPMPVPTSGQPLVSKSIPPPPPPAAPKKKAPPPPPPDEQEDDGLGALYDLAKESETAVAHPQSPRCPKCMAEMMTGAVLCTNCGFDTRSGKTIQYASPAAGTAEKKGWFGSKKKTATGGKAEPVDMMAPQGSYLMGVAGSAIGAIVGGAIWFAIAYFSGYELGFIAMAIGALAGVGMQIGQKGYSNLGGVTAAGITLLAILGAKAAVIFAIVFPLMREEGDFDSEDDTDYALVEYQAGEELKAKGITDEEDATEAQSEAAYEAARKKVRKMSKQEQAALQKKMEENDTRESLVYYVAEEIAEEKKLGDDPTDEQYAQVEKEAEQRVSRMTPDQRTAELKRQEAAAEAKYAAQAKNSGGNSGGGGAGSWAGTGLFIVFLLLLVGWKSIIWIVFALGLAYKTASGAVSG